MTHTKREIPWNNVVQFHKEIVHRAEETFFMFPSRTLDSERWSPIKDFFPTSLAGPWSIPKKSVVSQPLELLMRGGDLDSLFIGHPRWSTRRHVDSKKWVSYLQPILYREVRAELDSENRFRIVPEKGNWEISPLVFEFMEQKGTRLEKPLDEILLDLIEMARLKSEIEEKDLTRCLIEELGRVVPELGYELNKIKSPPASHWILFTPPATASGYNKHLVSDYVALEKQLESDSDCVGGLRLLEDIPPTEGADKQIDILPITPLNDSQHKAVTDALKSAPVTVISGPPGCGKSQVVISLLLNAWANGTSVLFASNNNKAVDVVRERFERFENEFPIAARAGSSKVSNIGDTLRRTLNGVAAYAKPSGNDNSHVTTDRYKKLLSGKEALHEFLDSKIPHRVDESFRSALNAYGRYHEVVHELTDAHELYVHEIKDLGYDINPHDFTTTITKPLRDWLEGIEECRQRIEQDSQDRSKLLNLAAASADMRNRAVQRAGLNLKSITDWNWLVSGPGPERIEVWLESYKSVLSQPLEQRLAPIGWQEVFNDWNGEADARNWSQRGQQLVKDIKHTCDELSPKIAELEIVRKRFNEQFTIIRNANIPDDIQVDPDLLSEWLAVYAAECLRHQGTFDWWPWSQHRKRVRKLRSIEVKILPAYPLSVMYMISEMAETMGEIIELTRKWIAIRNQWDETKTIQQEIKGRLGTLRENAMALFIDDIPDDTDLSAWLKLAEIIKDKTGVADDAAEVWQKRVVAEETRERLREVATEFRSVTSGVPIKDAWVKGLGHDFAKSVSALSTNPTSDDVVSARTLLCGESVTALLNAWHEARDCEVEFRAHEVSAVKVLPELSRITDWWDGKPSPISVARADYRALPDGDDELWKHRIACEERDGRWKSYTETTLPDKENLRDEELKWAIDHLRRAFETVPVGHDDKVRIGQIVKPMIDRCENNWQTDNLQKLFESFNTGRIKEEISRIDARLEGLSFEIAKNSWLRRVADDAEAQDAVGTLLQHYTRNSYRIGSFSCEIFAKALRIVPIWITTAQSSQSIPMYPGMFDLLVIDEATQCTLTNLLPMIHRAKRMVVIGDPEQLPAIGTIGYEAEKSLAARFGITDTELLGLLGHAGNDVYKTAVQCMSSRYADVTSLNEHYRSHPLIIGFANQHIYHKRLRLRKDPDQTNIMPFGAGVYGRQVNGCCKQGKYGSWVNPPEVDAVCELVKQLRACEGFSAFTIGVVTPFKRQALSISEKLDEIGVITMDITVGTAHKYQGDERDVMIFSPVVAKGISDGAARWVEEPHNLINVAVTRAREALFVVGDLEFCGRQQGILGKLVNYVKTVLDLRETSPYELELFSWMITQGWDPKVHVQIKDTEVDFVLNNNGIRLVIEVDGESAAKPGGEVVETHIEDSSKDASRDAFLQGQDYKVLHVKTRDMRETPQEVLHAIAEALELNWDDELID
ncbi:MAG: DUF559 domain-containing protein [Methanosarcinales archaeon]|nr:MAG: DUF559 domain-containing protein [Methanosarcinales archaeon]